jgi:hypothetical protein
MNLNIFFNNLGYNYNFFNSYSLTMCKILNSCNIRLELTLRSRSLAIALIFWHGNYLSLLNISLSFQITVKPAGSSMLENSASLFHLLLLQFSYGGFCSLSIYFFTLSNPSSVIPAPRCCLFLETLTVSTNFSKSISVPLVPVTNF